MRHIVDIREGSEVELLLPFYLGYNYVDLFTNSGQLDVQVLNELRAPETCSTAIDILVYFSGAEDIEFMGPTGNIGASSSAVGYLPFYPQIGDLDVNVIGGGNKPTFTTHNAEESGGEIFASIKQLLTRYSLLYEDTATTISAGNAMYVWPWLKGVFFYRYHCRNFN